MVVTFGALMLGILLIMATCDRTQVKLKFSREFRKLNNDFSIIKWEDNEYGYLFDKDCDYYLATLISKGSRSEILVRAYDGYLIKYYTPAQTKQMLNKCQSWHIEKENKSKAKWTFFKQK